MENVFGLFTKSGNSFPKDYNEAEYYPVLIDEFYRWYCKKHNIKIPDPDEEEGF